MHGWAFYGRSLKEEIVQLIPNPSTVCEVISAARTLLKLDMMYWLIYAFRTIFPTLWPG